MPSLVTYDDFPSMGFDYHPQYIRRLVRVGKFPKPIKGAGCPDGKRRGVNAKFHWRRKDVEDYLAKKPRQV